MSPKERASVQGNLRHKYRAKQGRKCELAVPLTRSHVMGTDRDRDGKDAMDANINESRSYFFEIELG
jgi:hypothetical protein